MHIRQTICAGLGQLQLTGPRWYCWWPWMVTTTGGGNVQQGFTKLWSFWRVWHT